MVRLPSRGILKKAELNSSDRKMLGAWGPGNILGMRTFGGDDGNVLYLDCCGDYMSIYICKNSLKYILKMGLFYCM